MVYFFMFLSAISSYVYRGQTISQSFSAEPTLLYLLFYFVLKRYHMTIIQIEKIIYISSLLFVISYIIQNISLSIKTKTKIHKHLSFYTGFKKGRNFKYKKIKSKNSFPCMFFIFP